MMDSVVGDDQTLPFDINGSISTTLPNSLSLDDGDFSMDDNMTAPSFPDKMSPFKPALTMKDYENQITALKKENFNLKLRIYFMEDRNQREGNDSTEEIYRTNMELKVEVESLKRELGEKQELLLSASKALDSLAGRESGGSQRAKEQSQKEMDALRDAFNKKIAEMEQDVRAAEQEMEKMAAIAEQEKLRSFEMEKQLQTLGPTSGTFSPLCTCLQNPQQRQQVLQEKESVIEQLRTSLVELQRFKDQHTDPPNTDNIRQLSTLIGQKDEELETLREELIREKDQRQKDQQDWTERQSELSRLHNSNRQLADDLQQIRSSNQNVSENLEEAQNQIKVLSGQLDERRDEISSEKKNSLKRDKTIQGLTLVLKEKEKEIDELRHEIEDRDEALSKAREAAHKAQLQKYQGAEEQQNLLMEKQSELALLQGDHRTKVLEGQKLQRSLARRDQELADLQQAKEQLEVELEDLQQEKKKGDKALNDAQNQLKKLSGEVGEREAALELQNQELLERIRRSVQGQEVTIQRLTATLADKEQQLQEYMNMVRDFEHSKTPGGSDIMVSKLRERLKQKEKALEQALDEKFAAIEEKDNEIHQLQLYLREKDRDLERLNNLQAHNEETINSFDCLIKEKDTELQQLVNTLKNLQRSKQDAEDHLNRALRERDAIISQLELSLEGKTRDMEKLLERGQERDHFLSELRQQEAPPPQVLELRQTIQLLQERLSESQAELSMRSSEENMEKVPLAKKTAVVLKKELAQKTEALNKALKRENELKISLAELQSVLSELEGRLEGQGASIDSLTATLETKDEIINELHKCLGQRRDSHSGGAQQQAAMSGVERSLPSLPQRERTIIGGDSQQETPASSAILQVEREALNRALRTEQQLYSSLVRTVKEHDSAQRLHGLQMELTAIQLLRQQLEDGIRSNEELREDLETEIHRAKLREGAVHAYS